MSIGHKAVTDVTRSLTDTHRRGFHLLPLNHYLKQLGHRNAWSSTRRKGIITTTVINWAKDKPRKCGQNT